MNHSHHIRLNSLFITCLFFLLIMSLSSSVVYGSEITDIKETSDFDSTTSISGELSWSDITLTDAITKDQFTLSSLLDEGQPVVMQTFAIWCSACSSQLKETTLFFKKTHGMYPVCYVDIDPNEKIEDIESHVIKNNFSGYFAAAPAEFSVGLAQDAGIDVLMQIPRTFIFSGDTAYKLPAGVYPADTLTDIISVITEEEPK